MKEQNSPDRGSADLAHNEDACRYELRLGGAVAALAQYRREGDCICFTHTEVEPAHEGQGLGSQLAAFALDDVKRRGLKARPQCRFIASYIARHEDRYGALVER